MKFIDAIYAYNFNFYFGEKNYFHIVTKFYNRWFDRMTRFLFMNYVGQLIMFYNYQLLEKRFNVSNYHVKDVLSDLHGHKLYLGVIHINTYNLWKSKSYLEKMFVFNVNYNLLYRQHSYHSTYKNNESYVKVWKSGRELRLVGNTGN